MKQNTLEKIKKYKYRGINLEDTGYYDDIKEAYKEAELLKEAREYGCKARMFNIMIFNDNSIILEPSSYCIIMRKKELSVLYSMWEEIENILDKVAE